MTNFTCATCGKVHEGLPMDLAYKRPADYFKIPEQDRQSRIKLSEDLCSIDDKEFFIRAVLELPVKDNEDNFRWGTWAQISQDDFFKYLRLWDADGVESEPPFKGILSGGVNYYPDTDLMEVKVHLRSKGQRPLFGVVSEEHPLGIDQREGITLHRVQEIIEDYFSRTKK